MRSAACACALSFAGAPAPAVAAGLGAWPVTTVPNRQEPLDFDIAGQDLASALAGYAVTADQTILFSDELVAHRRSPGVRGRYTPQEALDLLLAGTRLRAERVGMPGRSSFVLRALDDEPVSAPVATTDDRRYDGLVQRRVWEALCAHGETAPGRYRAVLMLEVDATGRLLAPRLVATTGSATRDQAIVATLHGLQLGAAPPARLRQSLTLVILPRASRDGDASNGSSSSSSSKGRGGNDCPDISGTGGRP